MKRFQALIDETAPEKLEALSLLQLQQYYYQFHQLSGWTELKRRSDERVEMLRRAIELKRIEEQNERHHREEMVQGSTILYWTKWAVAVGVVVPILVALIAEIPFSRLLPAKASRASPASSPTATATAEPSATPAATESPLESPPASPTPELTSTPTATPIKFPPPAP